jgi:hydroxymethylglutaryl-CoA synthase
VSSLATAAARIPVWCAVLTILFSPALPLVDCRQVAPSQLLSQELGNTYCGSLYANLLSLISHKSDADLTGKRILMFSYGSGLAATMWSFNVAGSVAAIRNAANVPARLAQRTAVTPDDFTRALSLREKTHAVGNYQPISSSPALFPGTYALTGIDALKRRTYQRV